MPFPSRPWISSMVHGYLHQRFALVILRPLFPPLRNLCDLGSATFDSFGSDVGEFLPTFPCKGVAPFAWRSLMASQAKYGGVHTLLLWGVSDLNTPFLLLGLSALNNLRLLGLVLLNSLFLLSVYTQLPQLLYKSIFSWSIFSRKR